MKNIKKNCELSLNRKTKFPALYSVRTCQYTKPNKWENYYLLNESVETVLQMNGFIHINFNPRSIPSFQVGRKLIDDVHYCFHIDVIYVV